MFSKRNAIRKNEIRYKEPEIYQVGETTIELTFEDKRKFKIQVIGRVYQDYDTGRDENQSSWSPQLQEPRAAENVSVIPSTDVAKQVISNLNQEPGTYLDSQVNPKEARVGKVIGARILGTHGHTVKFPTAYVAKKGE